MNDVDNPIREATLGWDGCLATHFNEIHVATWAGSHNKANVASLSSIVTGGGGWTGSIAIEQSGSSSDRIFLARRVNGRLQVKRLVDSGTDKWAFIPRRSSIAIHDAKRWLMIATEDGVYSGSLRGGLESPTTHGYPDEYEQWPPAQTYYGPVVGSVTEAAAKFWIYTSRERRAEVRCRETGGDFGDSVPFKPNSRIVLSQHATLEGLDSGQEYEYEVRIGVGPESEFVSGRFATAPIGPTTFTMAFSSCSDRQSSFQFEHADLAFQNEVRSQSTWRHLGQLSPRISFHMLLGDTIYLPWTSTENERPPVHRRIWRLHLRQRSVESFADAVRTTPTIATWDDHDFGENNSDSAQKHKKKSLNAFRELVPNPDRPSPSSFDGINYIFTWGDVEFFVPDGRYHRTGKFAQNVAEAGGVDAPEQKIFGDEQMEWLIDAIRNSDATFKVIVSGVSWNTHADSWKSFPNCRAQILDCMSEVPGILLFSGDIHFCRIRVPRPDGNFDGEPHRHSGASYPYPLYEFISSGIARPASRVYGEAFETADFTGSLDDEERKKEYGRFVAVDFDTEALDPTARARVVNRDGSDADDQSPVTVRLSELQPGI